MFGLNIGVPHSQTMAKDVQIIWRLPKKKLETLRQGMVVLIDGVAVPVMGCSPSIVLNHEGCIVMGARCAHTRGSDHVQEYVHKFFWFV